MSGSSEILKRQIAGTENIAGVVRSMKALAASSITQYENAVASLDGYYQTVERALSACMRRIPRDRVCSANAGPPLIGVIIFGSDQGLVGRFNEALWDFAYARLKALPGNVGFIWTIGDRINDLVVQSKLANSSARALPGSVAAITPLVDGLLVDLQASLATARVVEVQVFHHCPLGAARYQPVGETLLPMDAQWQSALASQPWPHRRVPDLIGNELQLMQRLTNEYLFILLYRACAQSLCSENASRLVAMQRAERNIDDLHQDLTRRYQRLRQESIDEELFDVLSGYESQA